MRTIKLFFFFLILSALLCECTQTYVSPYKAPASGYLVVEGYISGNSPTQFTLSRTIPLPGDSTIPMVTGATVQVEGNDNSVYPLADQGNGTYGDSLTLNPTAQYRLRITIPNGESYLSDFVQYKPTPAIDSINWVYNKATGVMIYANTHDVTNSTRYYQWEYVQTWEYYSAQQSYFIYEKSTNSLVPRTAAQMNYVCWQTVPASSILIGSSAKLANDVIYEFPLVSIPANSQPLGVLYSILVKQYALTEDGYNFLSLMQLNTESLGSIFDVQPSVITGNIHCLTVPSEQVIGYISAGSVQQQRIFIDKKQLPSWDYRFACALPDTVIPNDSNAILSFFSLGAYVPIGESLEPPPGSIMANVQNCIDCQFQGGSTQKPSFWPN